MRTTFPTPIEPSIATDLRALRDRAVRFAARAGFVAWTSDRPVVDTLHWLDVTVGEIVRDRQTPAGTEAALLVTHLGATVTQASTMASGVLFGAARRSPRTAAYSVAAVGGCSAFYTGLKLLVQRERPGRDFHRVVVHDTSFPSGHTATAFAAARTLHELFGIPRTPLLLAAAGVGYTRVYLGVHHPGDVVAGALIGWFWSAGMAKVLRPERLGTAPRGAAVAAAPQDAPGTTPGNDAPARLPRRGRRHRRSADDFRSRH